MKPSIYLDYNATTPLAPVVIEAMTSALQQQWGNPSSVHWAGRQAKQALSKARRQLASLLGCQPRELLWTSGATESNNLVLRGVLERQKAKGRKHLIVSAIEHPAVLQAAQALEEEGIELTLLPCTQEGIVSVDALREALRPDTALVSVMAANNETGVLQPIRELGTLCRQQGVLFHSDMVQWLGKAEFNLAELPVDLASFSAHKFYGPKGVGALFVRKKVGLSPMLFGGKQEQALRPGTENLPGIVGMGAAAAFVQEVCTPEQWQQKAALRQRLEEGLLELSGSFLNGHREQRLWNTVNLGFEGIQGTAFQVQLDLEGVAVSLGSACSSGSISPSSALLAMGLPEEKAANSLRFSLGWNTTEDEIEQTLGIVKKLLSKHQRRLSG